MENKINNLNHSAFQPAFISRIPIHPTFDYRLFSNKACPSIGSFQYYDQVHLNGVPSDSNYGILISYSMPNQFTYRKFDFINLHTIDSMFIPAKDGVVSSRRGGVLDSVHWPPNEVGTNDRCQVLENISENVKAVLYSKLPCIAADNRHIGPINLPNISIMDQGKKLKKSRMVREKWKTEENMKLVRFVEKHGEKQWSKIAQSMSGRTGKQCRERWHNHVKPNIKENYRFYIKVYLDCKGVEKFKITLSS